MTLKRRGGWVLAVLVVLMQVSQAAAQAAPGAPGAGAGAVAGSAFEVVQGMARYLDARQSYGVTIVSSINVNIPRNQQNLVTTHQVTVASPNRIAMRQVEGPPAAGELVSDGQTLFASLPATSRYIKQSAPATFADFWDQKDPGARDRLIAVAQIAVINMLMMESMQRDALIKSAQQGQYVGIEPVSGKECHHVRLAQQAGGGATALDLWIQTGDEPLLRRVTPDMSFVLARLAQQLGDQAPADMKLELNYELGNWKVDQPLADDAFAYQPKPGLQLADSLVPQQPQPQAAKGVGEPAPGNVPLKTLEGKPFDLAQEKNRVVVLDFWATWCGPCRMGLPGIQKIHDWAQQQKKPVSVYAVNLQETPEQIKAFWKDQKLTMPVLLDSGPAAQAFGVNGIPHTVLIVDGIIQDVQIGYREGHEKHLMQKIDQHLAKAPAESK